MREVVVAGYLRTAQSRSRPKDPGRDWFHALRADDLLARVVPELLTRTGVSSAELDDFLVGCALGVRENWTFGGRTPVYLADLDARVPAKFIDQQCGSGMACVHTGFLEIASGAADMVLACGMEQMTRIPMGPTLFKEGAIVMNPALYEDPNLAHWDMDTTMVMGRTAEKLAREVGFSRREMDAWAVRSHTLAAKAHQDGFLPGEILPVQAPQADGGTMLVDRDQAVRPNTNLDALGELKPVFDPEGLITAGNASPLNSGAAAMILMSSEKAAEKGIAPLARIRSIGFAGVDPTVMGKAPVPASRRALDMAGLKPGDVDFWEINEAFSVVVLHAVREMALNPERVNIMGGALAVGHAMGATGVRLVGTLARILRLRGASLGCAASCIGGGQGVATIIETM